jgi:RNA polymerase sigma-70 factor (ECF subfamily)
VIKMTTNGAVVRTAEATRWEVGGRIRKRDRSALAAVYDGYVEKVARMIRRGCSLRRANGQLGGRVWVAREDLADVVQEVFVKAFSRMARGGHDGGRDYEPYLLMIARNTMIDWARRRTVTERHLDRLRSALPPHHLPAEEPPPWEDGRNLAAVERYLTGLTGQLGDLYRKRYLEGRSQEEAAQAMSISRQTVRTLEQQLRRGLARSIESGPLPASCTQAAGP